MNNGESPDRIEYIRTEVECKDWASEEMQSLNSSLKICCIPLPRRLYLFFKYVAPTFIMLISFVAEIYSDVAVAIRHYIDGHFWWFSLTLLFLCAPAIMFIIYAIGQLMSNSTIHLPMKLLWVVLYVFTGAGLLLWPLWSYLKRLYYVVQAMLDKDKSVEHLEKFHGAGESKDNMQKLFKAFLEAAPQLLLQLYILFSCSPKTQDVHTVIAQVVAVVFSLNAMTIVVVHFEVNSKHHRSRAQPQQNDDDVGELCCVIVEYLWWFSSITARILALAFFASVFKYWVFLICAIHALTISACLICNPPSYTWKNCVISLFMGFVYIFCFVEYKVDFARLGRVVGLYSLYYGFTFVQNICMVLSAYYLAEVDYWYHLPMVVSHFFLFFLAIILMLFYLGMLRPFYLKYIRDKIPIPVA